MTQTQKNQPTADHTAQEALERLDAALAAKPKQDKVPVTVEERLEAILIPCTVATNLRKLLANAAKGVDVDIIPAQGEMTTQQAADILNVSRPYVVKLIDEGALPAHKVGTHRRIATEDLYEYKRVQDIKVRAALDELTRLDEEMGLYE